MSTAEVEGQFVFMGFTLQQQNNNNIVLVLCWQDVEPEGKMVFPLLLLSTQLCSGAASLPFGRIHFSTVRDGSTGTTMTLAVP